MFPVPLRRPPMFLALVLFAGPPASAETVSPEQRAVLSAICANSDISGLNCKRARKYPQKSVCNVQLAGRLYQVADDTTQLVIAPYTSDCEPHVNNFGGSVVLVQKGAGLVLSGYDPGVVLANDCQAAKSGSDSDQIYCVTSDTHRGVTESDLSAYSVQSDSSGKYSITSGKTIATAEDQRLYLGYLSVHCDHHIDFFDLSHLDAGPAQGTLALDVVYADSQIIGAACAPGKSPIKDVRFRSSPGQANIKPDAAKKARYVYDTQSGEFTTLERFTMSTEAAPARVGAIAPVTEKRIALVIGNSGYQKVPALANPASDAPAVAESLRKLGFVDVKLVENADENTMLRTLGAFAGEAVNADWAVVYFAGHGLVVDGKNYLVPTDATLATDKQVSFEAVSLDQVMDATSGARGLRLVILDACRDDPFARKMVVAGGTRSLSRGLAPVEPHAGTMVVYAARDGGVAKDGAGDHSPFTEALLKYLGEPNLELSLLFRKVRDEVLHATDNGQEPNTYGSLPGSEFYFAKTVGP